MSHAHILIIFLYTTGVITVLKDIRNRLQTDFEDGKIEIYEYTNIKRYINQIITHITDGNEYEEEVCQVVGGNIIVTDADELVMKGEAIGLEQGRVSTIIELVRDQILSPQEASKRLGLSEEEIFELL